MADAPTEDLAPLPHATNLAGFWRRFFAFSIDGLLIGVPAYVAGIFLFDQFAALGNWGRLVGFIIALGYFGVSNSAILVGQTVGKRFLSIQVVNESGRPVSLGRSLFRYFVFGLPFFLNGATFFQSGGWWASILGSIIVFGFGGTIIYLLIFNRRNRRSLHDLLAGTHVIRTDRERTGELRPIWKGHFVILVVTALSLTAAFWFAFSFIKPETLPKLLNVQRALLAQPHVVAATVVEGTMFISPAEGETTSNTFLNMGVLVKKRPEDYARRADELISAAFDSYPEAQKNGRIVVTIGYGYNLGIASSTIAQSFNFTPAEWQQRTQARAVPEP